MAKALFRPPRVDLGAELRWMLLRAFGPIGQPLGAAIDPAAALRAAQTYRLVQRIVARTPRETLLGELGRDATVRAVSLQALGEAKSAALARALPEVVAVARECGAPVALLKYAALLSLGVVMPAGRGARDLDVLVSAQRARALSERLAALGLAPDADATVILPPGQLQPLVDGSATVRVEIHTAVMGLAVAPGRTSATFEELAAAHALADAPAFGGACLVPSREVVVAHALVHGLVQHGFSPRSYSLLKMAADLVDLGVGGPGGPELLAAACRWLPADRWGIDVDTVAAFCRALAAADGTLLDPAAADEPARRLLDHCLAGPVDRHYRRMLKLRKLTHGGALRGRARTLGRSLRSAVFLTRREIDVHYGPPRSAWGYLGYRLVWPFDLVLRALPSAVWGSLRNVWR